ncbi:MAG: outer membrane protein [Beijerinckiaceae bacterium]
MRKVGVLALLGLLASPALAADMGPPPVLRGPLPMAEAANDWSGFYVGGFGGFKQMEFEPRQAGVGLVREMLRSTAYLDPGRADEIVATSRSTSNAVGYGLYLGYNWTMEDYVVGLEADYTKAQLKGASTAGRNGFFSLPDSTTYPHDDFRYTTSTTSRLKISDFGTIRGRIGAPMGSFMPYVTGGLAWARASYGNTAALTSDSRSVTQVPNGLGIPQTIVGPWGPAGNYALKDGSRTRFAFGYAVGAGMDWALSQNLILRAEVMHIRFGNAGDTSASINSARAGAAIKF